MDNRLKYTIFETSQGWAGMMSSALGLVRTTLPSSSFQQAFDDLGEAGKEAASSPALFADFRERYQAYLDGEIVVFNDPLDMSQGTEFQRKVWAATRLVPYGETRSYAWVASKIDNPAAVRAVGNALGKNPLPVVIPCHRIIGNNGGLCGFGGGLAMKRRLLELERRS